MRALGSKLTALRRGHKNDEGNNVGTVTSAARRQRWRRFRRDESGAAAVELAIIFPIFMGMTFAFYDTGAVMVRQAMLTSSLDRTVRDLRLNQTLVAGGGVTTLQDFRESVCSRAYLLGDCENTMLIEFTHIEDAGDFPANDAPCVDRSPSAPVPVAQGNPGRSGETIFVRVCAPSQQLFPSLAVAPNLENEDGDILIRASNAYVNE